MMDSSPKSWKSIKPSSTVTLTDSQSLKKDVAGLVYSIKQILHIEESGKLCEWLFFRLIGDGDEPEKWLMIKIVDDEIDLRVYTENPDFDGRNRQDLIDAQDFWVFQQPDDPDNFRVNELKYTKSVNWDFLDKTHSDYDLKGFGEMQGKVRISPLQTGQKKDLLASIAEYVAVGNSPKKNPVELIFLEIGSPESEAGGLIRMLFGHAIRATEVDVLAIT